MNEEFSSSVRSALQQARVGCLSTVDEWGVPHVVPFCFAPGNGVVYSSIDEKPKQSTTGELGRVRNIRATGRAAMVVHHYEENWSNLGWIQIRGSARIVPPGDPDHSSGIAVLRRKYPQYENQALSERPVIGIVPQDVVQWGTLEGLPGND